MTTLRPLLVGPWPPGLLLWMALALPRAEAATHYVRSDGGSAAQCDGSANAAYARGDSSRKCAWQHPFIALPPNATPRIAGGDTLLIGPGSYMMGLGAPGTQACDPDAPSLCVLAPVPSGPSPSRPTRILGHSYNLQCPAGPELWATRGARAVLQLDGSDNVEIACLELTDHSSCVIDHNREGTPRGANAPCADASSPTASWGENGIHAADSRNVLLRDLHIHGLGANGVRAGRLRDWTLLRVRLRANGWAGWDGNLNEGGGQGSSNSGTVRFSGGEIAWNGCAERYPDQRAFGCWAQQQGGYGDGLGTETSGGDWVFEDMSVHHNASDGLDLLYLDGSGHVTIRRVRAQGNAGNQIKVSGPLTIENTIALGDCGYFADFPTSNLGDGDHCRAKGNTLSIRPTPGALAVLRHNTIAGQGDCLMITTGGAASARVLVQNNAFVGGDEWGQDSLFKQRTCAHYAVNSQTPVTFEGNLFWHVKDDFCPPGNLCARDPLLTRTSYPDFEATPRTGSPLIDAGQPQPQPDHDFFRHPRPIGTAPDIGAIEVQASGHRASTTGDSP
ncbi:choice-of-anchor Q domain-containing protein [Lysobacter koreensis]|uniref:Choice-of-anchor Q domain-containing protein n=1 Tax=Lysobacter koreensis TaxID=266122 RepID=A0ABW2YI96_9GAMM